MKKLLVVVCLVCAAISTKATIIAKWTFETSIPTTAGPFSPEEGSGSASGFHTGAAAYSNPVGNGSAESFSATAWAVGDYWQFQVSTIGFTGIGIQWDQAGSSTGPRDFVLKWSTDGSTFTQIGSGYTVLLNNDNWSPTTPLSGYTYNPDLSSIAGSIEDQAAVYFRLENSSTVSIGNPTPGVVGAGGTDRVDNFIVTAVPEPVNVALVVFGGIGVGVWGVRRWRARRA